MHHPTGPSGAAREAALAGAGLATEVQDLREQVATLTGVIENLKHPPAPVAHDPRMDELEQRLRALTPTTSDDAGRAVSAIERRLRHLEDAEPPVDHTGTLADLTQRLRALEALHGLHKPTTPRRVL